MEKLEVLRRLEECGVVAVVRGNSEEEVMKIIDACIAGGIIGIEVTFTVPGAADIIKALAKRYDPKDVLIGAGTVLDVQVQFLIRRQRARRFLRERSSLFLRASTQTR